MPAKKSSPLTAVDLTAFIAEGSDFALEMAALNVVRSLDLVAEHAAVYTDPVSSKLRAYDIRARRDGACRHLRFAIECKNLSPAAPLLIHATPRLEAESYHTVVARYRVGGAVFYSSFKRVNVYEAGVPVGRQTDQPSKTDKGEFRSVDTATFEKWLQAVNGCVDLLREMTAFRLSDPQAWSIVPALVVPSGTLWQIDYDSSGAVTHPVRPVEEASVILRHSWTVPGMIGPVTFDVSHLEVITLPRLQQRLTNLIADGGLLAGAEELAAQAAR